MAYSLPRSTSRSARSGLALFLGLLFFAELFLPTGLAIASGTWPRVQLQIARVTQPATGLLADGLRIEHDPDTGVARVTVQSLQIAGLTLSGLQLDCPHLHYSAQRWACPQGGRLRLALAEGRRPLSLPLQWQYQPATQAWQVRLDLTAQTPLVLEGNRQGGRGHFNALALPLLRQRLVEALTLDSGSIDSRASPALLTALSALEGTQGQLHGHFSWHKRGAQFELQLQQGAFSTADGMHAAENLELTWRGEIAGRHDRQEQNPQQDWSLTTVWQRGGVFWAPWYLAAAGQQLHARGHLDAKRLTVTEGSLQLEALGQGRFAGQWSRREPLAAAAQGRLQLQNIDLGGVYQALLAPLLAQHGAPEFIATGQAHLDLSLDRGRLAQWQLSLDGAGLQELRGRYGLNGVDGHLHWSASKVQSSQLQVGEARFGALRFAPFALPLQLGPQGLHSERIEAPLLDSRLLIDQLHVDWGGGAGVDWGFGLALHPLSLSRLAEPLGLPAFGGSLSASLPRIHQRNNRVSLDGSLVIQAFDGYFAVDRLSIEDPLGHLPRLNADVDLRHIDLEQLTTAFAFGRITGLIDGEIRDLQLAGWQPQAFSARIRSSPGDYPRRISQRAVENISALGGASAAAAVQRSFLRFFETFGYRRIGLACTLRQGVCQMGGLEDGPAGVGDGYVIVEGGGIPALNVIGYNRRVDWPVLVERLQRITDRNMRPVIR